MMINRTLSIGILKNDLIYILLETDERKQDELFQQIYEDISKNLVPIRPDRHYTGQRGSLRGNIQIRIKELIEQKSYRA